MTAPDAPGLWTYSTPDTPARTVTVTEELSPPRVAELTGEATRFRALLPGRLHSDLISVLARGEWERVGDHA